MGYQLDFSFLVDNWPAFVAGAWLTIRLTVASIALGFAVGATCAVLRVYGHPLVRRMVAIYVEIIRNTPLLVQIFFIYFDVANLGLKLSADFSAVLALLINGGDHTTDIMPARIQAIPRTQLAAAGCLGLTR